MHTISKVFGRLPVSGTVRPKLVSTKLSSRDTLKHASFYSNRALSQLQSGYHHTNRDSKGVNYHIYASLLAFSIVSLNTKSSEGEGHTQTVPEVPFLPEKLPLSKSSEVTHLLADLFDAPIPSDKVDYIKDKTQEFLNHVDLADKTEEEKMKAIKLFIRGYKKFFFHYDKFPNKLKQLYKNPEILDKCNYQLYHIAGIPFDKKDIHSGLLFHTTPPTQDTMAVYHAYKNSVKQLGESGIMALGEGRGAIHIPWSLAASKIVMRVLENAKAESLNSLKTSSSELERDYLTYVDVLSNAILNLVIWAVTVDDIPDSMSKEMPKEVNQTFLNAMTLISKVEARREAGLDYPEDIFNAHPGELEIIKEKLNSIPNEVHRVACKNYIEGAYTAFHNAWDSLQALADISDDSKSQLRQDFSKIMTSFQHALDVNYDPNPFNIQKAEDVHYGMHIVIFFEMALTLAEKLTLNNAETSYSGTKSKDYIDIFRRQTLLMQKMGSIANLICTGVSENGAVSRELMDGDFSNQLIFDALERLAQNNNSKNRAKSGFIENLLKSLTNLKELKRDWFLHHGADQETLSEEAIREKDLLEKNWNSTVTTFAETITDSLPDLFDKWYLLYTHLKNYDKNEFMSEDAIVFLFQNIVVKGKL